MSDRQTSSTRKSTTDTRTWTDEIEVVGDKLVSMVKQLIESGNVTHIVIRGSDDTVLMDIPLLAGVAITILMPWLVLLGALGATVARVKIEVVRQEGQ